MIRDETCFCLFFNFAYAVGSRISLRGRAEYRRAGIADGEYPVGLDHFKVGYSGQITVGSAKEGEKDQVINVLFDTGSPQLVIISVKACPNQDCTGQKYEGFDGTKSSTYEVLPDEFTMSYTDGTKTMGHLAKESIKLGVGDKAIVIKDQIFAGADVATGMILQGGIFGLGLFSHPYLPGNPDPPMANIIEQQHILPEFGFYLDRYKSGNGIEAGELVFGGHDEDLVEGEFTYHPVLMDQGIYNGWRIKLDKISVVKNGVTIPELPQAEGMWALPDSGTSVITGPRDLFVELHKAIYQKHNTDYTKTLYFDCSYDWSLFPNVVFTMGGVDYTLTGEDYKWDLNDDNYCRSFFLGRKGDENVVLGQPFMETFYTKFDMKRRIVGFAKAKMRKPNEGHHNNNNNS